MKQRPGGFTLVELLIVVVVLSILAAISMIAYNGIQERARSATLQSDLSNASKQVELVYALNDAYPTTLPAETTTTAGNVLQMTHMSSTVSGYCINGYGPGNLQMSISSRQGLRNHLCNGAVIGSPIGGDLPTIPRGSNLVPDFSTWEITGGVSYDAASGELRLSGSTGSATSPLVRIDGSSTARAEVEAFATQASPLGSPNSNVYWGSLYYGDDGVTQVLNTSGHSSNGNAQNLPLSSWRSFGWTTATGPNVRYIKFRIHSHPSGYTSDNRYRNPRVLIP